MLSSILTGEYSWTSNLRLELLIIVVLSNLGHSADPTEINDLEKFFSKVIPPENSQSAGL